MLIDSHCHLHFIKNYSLDKILENATNANVGHILCVATALDQHQIIMQICDNTINVSGSVGVHPNELICNEPTELDLLELATSSNKIVAIGETGLDYYHNYSAKIIKIQQNRFITHIETAKQCNKPLIVHSRNARDDTIKIIKEEGSGVVKGVLHCFTENLEMAEQAINLNFLISFSGIITFKKAKELQRIAKILPLDKILIETDAPYLAPEPLRGRINQPAYIRHVAGFLAELRGITIAEVIKQTGENYYKLFGKI